MKRRIKTKKKKIKKYKSKNKRKSRKNKKRLKGGALQLAGLALGTGVGSLAYMGKDGPRKCMFEDCQSHYYHFRGNRGWWDSSTRFYQGGEKAKRLEGYKDDDYDGKNPVCPKCVERYEEGKRKKLLITTLNGLKDCDFSCGTCNNKYCDGRWWKSDEHSIYGELGFNSELNWVDPITKLTIEKYCPECSLMFEYGRVCLKCNKPLEKIERRENGGVDYCISCYGNFLSPKSVFNLNEIELTVGGILIFQEERKEYKARIEGIYDDKSIRCEILSLKLNEWNDLKLPWLSNPLDNENYSMEKTIIVINDLQICLRLLSLVKLLYEEYVSPEMLGITDLDENILISIKENLVRILKHNVKPWVSIYDSSRSEYKKKLKDELSEQQLRLREEEEKNKAEIWGNHPN